MADRPADRGKAGVGEEKEEGAGSGRAMLG